MLAAIKSGVPYVPLDPRWPVTRLRYVLEEIEPSLVIVDKNRKRDITNGVVPIDRCVGLDFIYGKTATLSEDKALTGADPNALAYILYTSGSTGNPKGVMQTQGNVVRHISNYAKSVSISVDDRVSLLASYAVDAAVMDIYLALLHGAALHIFDPQRAGSLELLRWLEQNSITIYHSTPTLYRTLLPHLRTRRFSLDSLRFVVLGGEEVMRSDIDDFKRYFPSGVNLINGYGPSECTLAMQKMVKHDTFCGRSSVPLGRTVEGVRVSLVRGNREVKESYKIGEIILGSPHLAVGYWRQPRLTASKFVATPDGGRRYRTGDLGRLLPGGEIEYAGRIDARIKIRGYSIEAAEVENAVLEHSDVAHAAAVSSATGDQGYLVLYVVAQPRRRISGKSLHRFLQRRLPSHMRPSKIFLADCLPLTASGKLDRQALRQGVESTQRPQSSPWRSAWAKGSLCVRVCKLWSEMFERPVFRRSNFFRLGGDSLTATNVLIAVEEQLGVCAGFELLFDNPTPEAFAVALLPLLQKHSFTTGRNLRKVGSKVKRALSFSQMRYWQRLQEGVDPACFNVCIRYAINAPVDIDAFRASLTEIMCRHDVLRTVVSSKSPRQTVVDVSECPLTVADYSSTPDAVAAVEDRIRCESALPFLLDDDLLVRFLLLKLTRHRFVFILAQHHLVTDSRSRQIFETDVNRAYEFARSGIEVHAEQPPANYANFVYWQRTLFYQSKTRLRRLPFWSSSLNNRAFVPCQLPTDSLDTLVGPEASSELTCSWSGDAVGALHVLSALKQVTMFAVALAAFNVVLYSYFRQPVICITTDFANRLRPAWTNVYGLFSDVLILVNPIAPNMSFSTFLVQVQNTIVNAMEKQYIPFADLVEQFFPGELGHYDELFPVGFFFERGSDKTVPPHCMTGLLRSGREVGNGTSSRPLMLSVYANASEIDCMLTYRCRLFRASAAARILEKLGTVIGTIARTPHISVEELAKC